MQTSSTTALRPRQGLALTKAVLSGLGLLLLVNIIILAGVGILKGSGVPKSIANPLQLLYFPLMWAGLRALKKKFAVPTIQRNPPLPRALLQAVAAPLLVGLMAVIIVFTLHTGYKIGVAFELLTTEPYRWLFMALMLSGTALVEEFLFRDYILNATLAYSHNFFFVTLLNASLFLLLHAQGFFLGDYTLLWGLAIFVMGLFLSAFVLRFRSLAFPVLFHAFWNISTTTYVENDKTFNLVKFENYPANEVAIADVTAGVCILFCGVVYLLLAYRRQATGRQEKQFVAAAV